MHVPVLRLIILGDEINVKKEKQRGAFFHLASPESPWKMQKKVVTQKITPPSLTSDVRKDTQKEKHCRQCFEHFFFSELEIIFSTLCVFFPQGHPIFTSS